MYLRKEGRNVFKEGKIKLDGYIGFRLWKGLRV